MDIVKLEKKIKNYLESFKIQSESELETDGETPHVQVVSRVNLTNLDNQLCQLRALAYQNGTSQITFNFGAIKNKKGLDELFTDYNVKNFGFKAVIEYNELRFYNQAFYNDVEAFMDNLDMCIGMFLSDSNIELIKGFLGYLNKR